MFTDKECPDCAGAPVNHTLQRWSLTLDHLGDQAFKPVERVRLYLAGLIGPFTFFGIAHQLPHILVKLRFAKFILQPQAQDTYRTRVMWESANRLGISLRKIRAFGMRTNVFVAEYKGKRQVFLTLPRPKGLTSSSYDWMDNKGVMKEKFQKQGFPVAAGGACSSQKKALEIFNNLKKPVVVKPMLGSRSRHTTIHIGSEAELLKAFRIARQICRWVVIEEQLEGMVFRVTLIGGKVFAALRREPPHIIGNGRNTIKELVEDENEKPIRSGPIFHGIAMDDETTSELERQHLNWNSVPKPGQVVTLNQKIGRSSGGSNTDVTDEIHPDNLDLFHNIAKFLDDPVVGIDFIIGDISRSWKEQLRCGVIECNAMPFIDLHHYPMVGQPRDAAGALWDVVFPGSAPGRS